MVIDTVAVAGAPWLSVTLAVIKWVPAESEEVTTAAPVPRAPSMVELQEIDAARLPSSLSVAVPVKFTALP